MRKCLLVFVILLFAMMLPSCSANDGLPTDQTEQNTASASDAQATQKFASQTVDNIKNMIDYIEANNIAVNSFILIKDGQTMHEAYFNGTTKDTSSPVYSCTKSVFSALVGIAIDEGKIAGVDEKITDLPGMDQYSLNDESKSSITLKHLLTMSSGLDPIRSNGFEYKDNAVQYILDQPILHEAGKQFVYTNAGPHLISAILQHATGVDTADYAQQKLFGPLGISEPRWLKDADGLTLGGYGLSLTPEQLAVFGCLYLNEGEYSGKQIVSKEWVKESTSFMIKTATDLASEQFGYGYLWWQNGFGGYSARGYAGQYIFVLPEYDAVVVFTSKLSEPEIMIPYQLMEKYVLPSLT